MPTNQEIAERLKNLRVAMNMSQNDFAEKLGVSGSSIAMYECGDRVPRDAIKVKIAKIFNVSVQSIFFDD